MSEESENQQKEPIDTEGRILMAADKEFMTKGYSGARTTAIAEAAGVTHAMLHYYFRSKENLFEKVLLEKLSVLAKTFMISFAEESTTLEECLRDAISEHFNFVRQNAELPRFIIAESSNNTTVRCLVQDRIKQIAAKIVEPLQRKIDEAVSCGACRPIKAIEIIMDTVSLNIFAVLSFPIVGNIFPIDEDTFFEMRRQQNIDTILRKIKP